MRTFLFPNILFLDFRDTKELLRKRQKPLIDFLELEHMAQSESQKLLNYNE